jgi:ubiquitin-protein ligase
MLTCNVTPTPNRRLELRKMIQKKRLSKELAQMIKDPPDLCSAGLKDSNLQNWIANIVGPSNTPYEGGLFKLDILITDEYPFQPPKMTFITKVYHCNISRNGSICLDILKDKWAPSLSIATVLLSIVSLLNEPNPQDPLEAEIANKFIQNRVLHDQEAREWTLCYANLDHNTQDENSGL